jgi:hypothetical protein
MCVVLEILLGRCGCLGASAATLGHGVRRGCLAITYTGSPRIDSPSTHPTICYIYESARIQFLLELSYLGIDEVENLVKEEKQIFPHAFSVILALLVGFARLGVSALTESPTSLRSARSTELARL